MFTCNNYEKEHINQLEELVRSGVFAYCVFGFEIGKEGTPHLQGYAELTKQKRFTTVKNMLGNQYHLERRKGTQSQAIEYCKKEKDFAEFGEKKNQGDRGDLKRAGTDALDEGIIFAIMNGANLQSIRYAEKILSYMEDERHWKPKVWWYWGPSGSGKSKRAMKTSKKYRTYWKTNHQNGSMATTAMNASS